MFDDTTSDARAVQYQVLRSIGMEGRIAMTVEREVLRLMIGDDLFREAFGEDRPQAVEDSQSGRR